MQRFTLATAFAVTCAAGFAFLACHSPRNARAPSVPGAATVAQITGVWAGRAEGTPFGDFPFALAFEREGDGSIHARTDDGKGMYLDFRFVERAGAWVLVEVGQIPQLGKQTHTLAATDATHWTDKDVDVALSVTGDALVMTTAIHGKAHATFTLQRKTGAEAEQIRAMLAKQASHTASAE